MLRSSNAILHTSSLVYKFNYLKGSRCYITLVVNELFKMSNERTDPQTLMGLNSNEAT